MKLKFAGGFTSVILALTLFSTARSTAQQFGERIYTNPPSGNFYSMANTNWPPLPYMPFDPGEVSLYYLGVLDGFTGYAYDDTGIVYPGHGGNHRNSTSSFDPPTDPGGGGDGDDPGPPTHGPEDYGTNLFIMIGPTNSNQAWLSLSNTHSGTYYQILSRKPLTAAGWDLGQIRQASGNLTPFDNVRTDDPNTKFYQGVGGDTVASIVLDPDYNLAVESATNGGPGQIGKFRVVLSPVPASSRTVVYNISGTASNGVDYTNLTGTVSVSASGTADIVIQPNFDTNVEFNETVSLSLVLTNGYVVDPTRQTAVLQIYDPRPQEMAVAILDSGWTKLYGLSNTNWNYFVLPEAMKEALRSDGTPFAVFSDLDIKNGALMTTNGLPKYPILISLANEVIRDDEIAPLTNYIAAGGLIFAGSSAFTRATNGSPRSNFALAEQMGVGCNPPAAYWYDNTNLTKLVEHRVLGGIPDGTLVWRMPTSPEETSWGSCVEHSLYCVGRGFDGPHQIWVVTNYTAQVLAVEDGSYPYITTKAYGSGYVVYDAALQPLIGHGGFGPGMHAYTIFRKAIEWAFESSQRPVVKLAPWPYQYNAAFMIRHDLENYVDEVADVEASSLVESAHGAKGDYYFSTGAITNSPTYSFASILPGLLHAVTNGATIGPHNGGLPNPRATTNVALCCLMDSQTYEYWHWGPDEALGLPGGKDYASNSVAISFSQIESWVTNQAASPRTWCAPYFNAMREDSYLMQEGLNVKITGDQKLTPFPAFTLSTRTDGKRYALLSEPVSDWFVGGSVAQSLDPWHAPGIHTTNTIHDGVDFYYNNGFLINFYSHGLSIGDSGTKPYPDTAGHLVPEYIQYALNATRFPRVWSSNAREIYAWWIKRYAAQIKASYTTNGSHAVATVAISGATDTNTAIEIFASGFGSAAVSQVLANGATNNLATDTNICRTVGELIKIRVGTTMTNVQVEYFPGPLARDDFFPAIQGHPLTVSASSGVLSNDFSGTWSGLVAITNTTPLHGWLQWNSDNLGGFTYTPSNGFWGTECFTYHATDGSTSFGAGTVTITVIATNGATTDLFSDDFVRCSGTALTPWQTAPYPSDGAWSLGSGQMQGINSGYYGYCHVNPVWTNYSVEAQVSFASGSYGGGVGGRLDSSGGHYAAWLYPGTTPGSSNVLKLIKFYTWNTWGTNGADNRYGIAESNLPPIGTAWHPLKLICSNNLLQVYYHGTNLISVPDPDSPVHATGSVSLDIYGGGISVSNLIVAPIP